MDTPQKPNEQSPHTGLSYQQDIHNTDMRDIVAEHTEWEDGQWEDGQVKEPPKPQEPVAPTPPPIEKSAEKPVETAPVTPVQPVVPQEPVKPPVDEEKLTDTMVNKLYEKLNPQTPEQKKDFGAKLKELNEKAKAENREPTYEEALTLLGEETKEKTKAELRQELKKEIMEDLNKEVDEEEKRQLETKKQRDETIKKNEQTLHGEWDRQLGILIERGDIPKVLNKEDETDPGMVAQKNLFEALNAYAKEQQAAGKSVSLNLLEAYMSPHFAKIMTQPGKDAPVNGARKSVTSDAQPTLNYIKDIHNRDLRDILAEVYEATDAQ